MPSRLRLKPTARAELTRRYRARQAAEADLVAYLAGLVDALGLDPERVEGYDDDAGELILGDPE